VIFFNDQTGYFAIFVALILLLPMKTKHSVFIATLVLLGYGCGSEEEGIRPPDGYSLVWNDEFNTSQRLPDTDEWWFETGSSGWGNNEIQNYVSGAYGGDTTALVCEGTLKIIARKRGEEVLSARINTSRSWLYGYFEARLKLPQGRGTWPAFWMLPEHFVTSPGDGEIDIMEEVGYHPDWVSFSIHCNAYTAATGRPESKEIFVPTAETDFHIYAAEWTPDFIKGYVDQELYFEFPNDGKGSKDTWPFNQAFYLKLNLAWGGSWGGIEGVDESCLPATYEIDYVRVFQRKENPGK
jgi:beta-glucanase (GH16 family)